MPVYYNEGKKTWKYRTYADDVYGNRKQFEKSGFKTKREALKAERELKDDGCLECNMTFDQLCNEYLDFKKVKLKEQSYRKINSNFKNHILPYFRNYKVKDINVSTYLKWQKIIEQKGFKHKFNTGLHGSVVSILNYAVNFHGLKMNIASKVGNFKCKTDLKRNVDFWTFEEFQKFIGVVTENIYKIFFETLYYTGLRQGECLSLTWKDFKDGYLDIYKTISKEQKDGEYIINTPKTSKSIRKIKLDKYLISTLNKLKDECKSMVGFCEEWYIFGCLKPLAPTTIGRKKDKYCEVAGVKKIRIHDFRHSHVSLLLSQGVPITVISQRLGHSDIATTLNIYSHLIPSDEDKAINIINEIKSDLK